MKMVGQTYSGDGNSRRGNSDADGVYPEKAKRPREKGRGGVGLLEAETRQRRRARRKTRVEGGIYSGGEKERRQWNRGEVIRG